MQRRKLVAMAAAGMVLAACGQSATPAPAAAPSSGPLAGVCPNPVVVQTDWFPESEYGAVYQMLGQRGLDTGTGVGDNPTFDTEKKRVTGALVDAGAPTGVNLEIRYGGPAIGFQQVSAQMYTDPTITLGQVSTDEAVQNSDKLPTVAVVAPLEVSPYMIMWDKAKHPDITSVADLGRKGVQVLYYQSDTYMQYLLGAGLLQAGQVDGSYDGSPSRWVSSGGEIAQAGFATSEPYIYKAELGGGRSYDVGLQLIADTGYPLYSQALAVKAADKAKLAPCLAKLVPMIQRAQVAFAKDPARANGVVVDAVKADKASVWAYSPGLAQFAVTTMRERGIIGNGPDATLGNLDKARVSRMVEILTPIFAAQNKPVKAGLTADQLYTDEFIDPGIGL